MFVYQNLMENMEKMGNTKMKPNTIYQGDAIEVLKTFPEKSIDMLMTSPPYWALRDYGDNNDRIWDADENCEHNFEEVISKFNNDGQKTHKETVNNACGKMVSGFCQKCNAWKGQLGLEPNFDLYIKHLCDIFDEVKRTLKDTGTIWVNLGDTYAGGGGNKGVPDDWKSISMNNRQKYSDNKPSRKTSITSKSLVMIPFRFAIEMVKRGWILRNTIVWHKPNCMPSSVKDRFTVDFEYLFFFSKKKKYYFEQQFEPQSPVTLPRLKRAVSDHHKNLNVPGQTTHGMHKARARGEGEIMYNPKGRNKRTVWRICPRPFKEAHFAVYPEELCETPIKAGCPKEVCVKCGKPKEQGFIKKEYIGDEKEVSGKFKGANVHSAGAREHYLSEQRKYQPDQKAIALFIKNNIKEKESLNQEFGEHTWTHWIRIDESGASLPSPEQYKKLKEMLNLTDDYDKEMLTTIKVLVDDKGGKTESIGYKPTCNCKAGFASGIVLDPFFGAGTTGLVALKQGKKFIGIELNPEYIEISKKRLKPFLEQQTLQN